MGGCAECVLFGGYVSSSCLRPHGHGGDREPVGSSVRVVTVHAAACVTATTASVMLPHHPHTVEMCDCQILKCLGARLAPVSGR